MKSIQEKIIHSIKDFFISFVKRSLKFIVLGIIFLIGIFAYLFYKEKTANWEEVTLYFYDNRPDFVGKFVIENGKIKIDEHCEKYIQKTKRIGHGSNRRTSNYSECIMSYEVYRSKDKKEFKVSEVERYEISNLVK